jgi:hypothetical protein
MLVFISPRLAQLSDFLALESGFGLTAAWSSSLSAVGFTDLFASALFVTSLWWRRKAACLRNELPQRQAPAIPCICRFVNAGF